MTMRSAQISMISLSIILIPAVMMIRKQNSAFGYA